MEFSRSEYLEPRHAPEHLRQADQFHKALDELITAGGGKKGDLGTLFRILNFTLTGLDAAIFDISNGQQVGYAVAHVGPGGKHFSTGASVGSRYQGRGYGFLAVKYIHALVASNTVPRAVFRDVITGETRETRRASVKILERLGSRRIGQRGSSQIWERSVPNPGRNISPNVDGTSLVFIASSPESLLRLDLGNGITQDGTDLIYREHRVGVINEQRITIPHAPGMIITNPTFWQGVDLMWQGTVKSGFKPDLNF